MLKSKGLAKQGKLDHPFLDEDLAQALLIGTGSRSDNLSLTKYNSAFPTPALEGKDARLSAEADNLENLTKSKIFQVSNKTHQAVPRYMHGRMS